MELKNEKDLIKLITLLRKNGVNSFKSGEIAIELAPSALFPVSDYQRKKIEKEAMRSQPGEGRTFTPEDIVFWSSGGIQ